jgi:hypothetical protein
MPSPPPLSPSEFGFGSVSARGAPYGLPPGCDAAPLYPELEPENVELVLDGGYSPYCAPGEPAPAAYAGACGAGTGEALVAEDECEEECEEDADA